MGLGALAVAIAIGVGCHGIAGLFPNGHFASTAAIGMAGQNMWQWKTALPIVGYFEHGPFSYYMHHPLGVFWVAALLGKLLGFSDWVLRLPAVIYVASTTAFIYLIGRDLWSRIDGGLAALGFVALPITLGYANYIDLEQPVMLGCVVSTWGYLRFVRTGRDRYALVSVLAFFLALNFDWQAYFWGAFFLFGLFVRAYVVPQRFITPALHPRSFGRYWALMAGTAIVAVGIEVVLINESGRLSDLFAIFFSRSSGSGTPLDVVLTSRRYRIELMFSTLAIRIGKLALPVILARAAVKRSDLELLPLPLLLSALVQYLSFKQGADVHIFWPHPFAAYFGLAVGALSASLREAIVWLSPRLRAPPLAGLASRAGLVALGVVGLPVAFVARDGLSLVRLSRETGGRFAEANLESDIDKAVALRWFLARMPAPAGVAFHPAMHGSWALQWEARPRPGWTNQPVAGPVPPNARVYMLDSRTAGVADLRAAASRFHVHAVKWMWFIDRQARPAPLDGYTFAEHEPSWRESWMEGGTEPVRMVVADPWVTWEWRTLLDQPALPPTTKPITDEQIRIAHNVALARGDAAAAAGFRAALAARFNMRLHATFDNKTELIGGVHARGAARTITLYFVAGTFPSMVKFAVRSRVVKAPFLSTLPVDPAELDVAQHPTWPTNLWKPGHIYSIPFAYRKRPGTERLLGSFFPAPTRTDARGPVEIAVVR
jgi:hypothetical protein